MPCALLRTPVQFKRFLIVIWIGAAKSLDINEQMLGRWVKEHRESEDGQAFRGNGKQTPEQEEIKRLKAEVKRLAMERDILKKATAFFAAETK